MMRYLPSNNPSPFATQLAHKMNAAIVGLLLLLSVSATAQTKYYVDIDADAGGDGSSWNTAFNSLQDALDAASATATDTVWVAEGTYLPSVGSGREQTFYLDKDMVLYGGFAGSETTLAERNWVDNPTILSGDLGTVGTIADNAYHVIWTEGLTDAGIIDGFTITEGNANGTSPDDHGGGIFNNQSSPSYNNCIFGNNAAGYGGGVYGFQSASAFTNCVFENNSAIANGAGMYNNSSNTSLTNCTMEGNTADNGGGMYNLSSNPSLTNCIIYDNQANGNSSSPLASIYNISSTPTISYSLIANWGSSGTNLDTDPLFVDADNGDLRLRVCSPALDAGDDSANSETTDLGGNPRKYGVIDMGAYETPVNLSSGDTLYVNAASTATIPDGTSWTNAYSSLGDALFIANSSCMTVTEIWVAQGTYHPTYERDGEGDRFKTFFINKDLKIYGGFAGTETDRTERDWVNNPTILSGDLGITGDNTDNAYHVLRTEGLEVATIIDGFTITAGNANGSYPHYYGGGMFNSSSSPSLTNCTFDNNNAAKRGGGMYNNNSSSPSLTNCTFDNNSAADNGGGMYNYYYSSPSLTNCTFEGNSADYYGGGMYNNNSSSPSLTNCIIWGNQAGGSSTSTSASIYNNNSSSSISYSLIANRGNSGTNIDTDPLFLDAANGDLRLQVCSPALNAGDDSANNETTDLGGNPRKYGTIDMGAYEYQEIVDVCDCVNPFSTVLYVNKAAFGANTGASWEDAFTNLQTAIDAMDCYTAPYPEIWVAQGTYYPTYPNGGVGDRFNTFYINQDLKIYGGFEGGESSLTERDWANNPTILSGDIDMDGDTSNNAYHVLWTEGLEVATIIDGFTVTGGNANGIIPENHGGGIFNNQSSPSYNNCIFENNVAGYGGGVYGYQSVSAFTNCVFVNNSATGWGAGMYNIESPTSLTNCTFYNNVASTNGGGMHNLNSNPFLVNCIIYNNQANGDSTSTSASISNYNSSPYIRYSLIDNSVDGGSWEDEIGTNNGNNLDANPLFIDAPNGDLRLQVCSPAMNAGDNTANDKATDIVGNNRQHGRIDMGAYESQLGIDASLSRLYVDSTATADYQDGNNWDSAYTSLGDAIYVAQLACSNVTEIWVAQGTYHPTYEHDGEGERFKTFYINKNLLIYGGFEGIENNLADRDWTENPTILSGDLDMDGDTSNNAYHVLWTEGLTTATIIDGFTVTEGNANGSGEHQKGGGMYNASSNFTVTNCIFSNNTAQYEGGGMFNYHSNPIIKNSKFEHNICEDRGGGLFNWDSDPIMTNCAFYQNSANQNRGGGMFNGRAYPILTNCTFTANSAQTSGGAINNYDNSNPALTNCIIWDNFVAGVSTSASASIYNESTPYPATATISFSLIDNSGGSSSWNTDIGDDGGNNIDTNPIFVDADNGDLRLQVCSPAINAGYNTANLEPTDLGGTPRKYGIIDMGAYETPVNLSTGDTLYVNAATAATIPDGTSWTNAYASLGDALFVANSSCMTVEEIWVAKGTYYPTYEHNGEGERFKTFAINKDLQIYGGFTGGEDNLADRDLVNNPTILSGDIGVAGVHTDNAYHVITTNKISEAAIIDGFTIKDGNADDGTETSSLSEGFYENNALDAISDFYFSNNLSNNDGGGMFNENANPSINNCIFEENTAQNNGGAILNFSSNPKISNCVFNNNVANRDGGAIFNLLYANPQLINATFFGNTAGMNGGGIFNLYSSPSLTNVILWGNTAASSTTSPSASIVNEYNSKSTFSYSLVANSGGSASWEAAMGGDGGNNIDTDPQFVDAPNGNLRLQTCSFAMDAGTDSDVPTVDLDGNPRPYNTSSVDIGAYEVQEERPSPEAICQNITVQLDADGTATITPAQIDNSSRVTCGDIPVLMLSQTEFTCADIGVNEVTLTVQDIFNNIDICTATVTVEEAELSVSGGALSVPITNGDNTPDIADGTHFGSTTSQVYTIVNNGQSTSLDLSSVVLSDNTNFSVVFITNPIGPGASGHCAIDFIGTGGPHTSMVTINSSNCDYVPFEFMIKATEPIIICPESHNLSGDIPTDTYEASGTITSDGTVAATSDVTFKANEIILTAGFTVAAGGTFTAQIDPCSESLVAEEVPTTTLKIGEEAALPLASGKTTITNASSTEKAPAKQAKIKTNNSELVIYPNPTNSHLTLACDCEIIAYKIMDTSGKVVKEGRQNHKTIDQLEVLADGFYFLQVLSTEGNYFKQFVKQ